MVLQERKGYDKRAPLARSACGVYLDEADFIDSWLAGGVCMRHSVIAMGG